MKTAHTELNCIDCKKDFKGHSSKQIRCKDCQEIYRNSGREHLYNRTCIDCDTVFRTKNGRCNKCPECFPKYTCEICGKDGEKTSNYQKYCSERCSNLSKADFYYDGNYSKTQKRDEYKCRACGSDHRLTVHHIDYSGKGVKVGKANNDMSNLITFCDSCHQKLHVATNQFLVNKYPDDVKSIIDEFIGDK